MAGGMNLATKYAKQVDERWTEQSQAALVLSGSNYSFKGDRTVVIYSIPIAPLNDYSRSGSNRYGTPDDLSRNIQTLTVSQDKGFTFIIDKGDEVQSEYVSKDYYDYNCYFRTSYPDGLVSFCWKTSERQQTSADY